MHMSDFFEKLIDHQLALGAITDTQGDTLRSVFEALSSEQSTQLEELLNEYPHMVNALIDNVGKKIQAIDSGDIERWKEVVAEEVKIVREQS